ncbi:MAG: hypothetical protein KA267_12185 [Gemmatimonadales bacterium]|nr:hypothetical protein [Gemmatimonadales bacterium]MBP7621914.1 hypothetical protein [Gemmatimonadales bacterium]
MPRDGYDPVPLVASARVILRARADSATAAPRSARAGPGPRGGVQFTVLEVIDSGGLTIPATLRLLGQLSDNPDFNTRPVPYRLVRGDGLRGACNAYTYQRGGEFLFLLQGDTVDALHPYWTGLKPTNEQVRGAADPWVTWVRTTRRGG